MKHNSLTNLIHSLHIVHHIPGRIRFKMDAKIVENFSLQELKTLDSIITASNFINTIRINEAAFSVIIEYNPQIGIDWQKLIGDKDPNEMERFIALFQQKNQL